MTHVSTRLATRSDVPAVLEMVDALAVHHGDVAALSLETLERDILGDTPWITVIVAEKLSKLLGYAASCPLAQLQFGVRGMDIHHLFVKPARRGQGIGRQLIEASIARSKIMGCRYIMVGTHPENVAAQQIYLAAGFSAMPQHGPRFRLKFKEA